VTILSTPRARLLSALALFLLASTSVFAAEEAVEPGWGPAIAKFINFAILAGALVYFARGPLGEYLRTRSTAIRKDLIDSKNLRSTAEHQLAIVRTRLSQLPGELAEMKRRGDEDLASEKVRLAEATAHERQRLIDQTRREIEMQSRVARRELVEHSVELSMALARTRLQKDITPEDQARLIERYSSGVRA
jgi:F-type H+-transporting ATPase subunit b